LDWDIDVEISSDKFKSLSLNSEIIFNMEPNFRKNKYA
jgi:hypothetical protein